MLRGVTGGKSSGGLKAEFGAQLFGELSDGHVIGGANVIAEAVIGEARIVELLDPFHSARCEIGGGAQTGAVGENLKCKVCDFERDGGVCIAHPEHGKEFAANFIHIRIAPLNDMGRLGQGGAENFEFIAGHNPSLGGRARFGNGDRLRP